MTPAPTRTVSLTSPTFSTKRDNPSSDTLSSRKSEVEDIFSPFNNYTSNSQLFSQVSQSQPCSNLNWEAAQCLACQLPLQDGSSLVLDPSLDCIRMSTWIIVEQQTWSVLIAQWALWIHIRHRIIFLRHLTIRQWPIWLVIIISRHCLIICNSLLIQRIRLRQRFIHLCNHRPLQSIWTLGHIK